jgi:hypothetical protein
MDEVKEELAHARSRGDYLVQLQKFVESGDLGWDFSDIFEGKEATAIRTSVNNNIEKHGTKLEWPPLKVMVGKDEHCIVVNLDAYESANSNGNGNGK